MTNLGQLPQNLGARSANLAPRQANLGASIGASHPYQPLNAQFLITYRYLLALKARPGQKSR